MNHSAIKRNTLRVTRTAWYHSIGPPAHEAKEIWFVLHGYGQLSSYFIRHFREISEQHRLIIAPEALSRFYLGRGSNRVGASWMTKEAREEEIEDYVAYLNQIYQELVNGIQGELPKLTVLGFSQGGATASRWITLGKLPASRLILWGGDVAHDLDLQLYNSVLNRVHLTLVVGDEDEFVTEEVLEKQRQRLNEAKIAHHLVTFKGGHRLYPDVLKEVAQDN